MYIIRIYTIFRDSKSKQYRATCCFCMERLCDKSSSHSTSHNSNMITEEIYEIESLFTSKRIGLRMTTTLSPEDTMAMRKYGIRRDHKTWLPDHKIIRPDRRRKKPLLGTLHKTFPKRQVLLDVSESPLPFNWSASCREEVKPSRRLRPWNPSYLSFLWPRKTCKLVH